MAGRSFIEIDSHQVGKHGQPIAGDVFLSRRVPEEDRIVCVLSDGLGSGVKANVLATLTSSMALQCAIRNMDVARAAAVITSVLPVCSVRKIAYSTFSIVDVSSSGKVRIMERGNPPCLLFRGGQRIEAERRLIELPEQSRGPGREVYCSEFPAQEEDRLVFFSDGVSQCGMGEDETPFGWGLSSVADFVSRLIETEPAISARDLTRRIVREAARRDGLRAKDDITCSVVYFRRPRQLLILSGPPVSRDRDFVLAETIAAFDGRKIICGGTTANIIARELGLAIQMDLSATVPGVPPASRMEGVDLVTEGYITMSRVVELLERGNHNETQLHDPASRMVEYMMDSDIICFVVGTRINEAHQDPSLPAELDIRRNIVRRIRHLLEQKYLKETQLRLV